MAHKIKSHTGGWKSKAYTLRVNLSQQRIMFHYVCPEPSKKSPRTINFPTPSTLIQVKKKIFLKAREWLSQDLSHYLGFNPTYQLCSPIIKSTERERGVDKKNQYLIFMPFKKSAFLSICYQLKLTGWPRIKSTRESLKGWNAQGGR